VKGILFAGGGSSRLYPASKVTSKQLLPVYDKPMIYYPLSTLMLFGIREVLIISTPIDTPNIEMLLGDGSQIGMKISYKIQHVPKGIAEAFTIGADFIGNDEVCLILGDNIFAFAGQEQDFMSAVAKAGNNATVFGYHVHDPERFGVVEFDDTGRVLSIEEKPKEPKSNYAVVGLYFYPGDVVAKASGQKPSARGELEITDLNKTYLAENRLNVVKIRRGAAWLDAGTPDALLESANYVAMMEKRQSLKLACIEEIAYNKGFIDKAQLQKLIDELKDCDYKKYLQFVHNGG